MILDQKLTQAEALAFLQSRFKPIGNLVEYVAGFETTNGRQFALLRRGEIAIIAEPGNWSSIASGIDLHKRYEQGESRAHFRAQAPRLYDGLPPIDKLSISTVSALSAFCDAYGDLKAAPVELLPTKSAQTPQTINNNECEPCMNTILYGPPGTGKTFKTAQLAVEICGGDGNLPRKELMESYKKFLEDGRISFVTFHQSYGYEDFVEGLRPELKDGLLSYSVRPGIFRAACKAAEENKAAEKSTDKHVLIIDEINRANISKVFGELITLLEPDKRAGETNAITVKLPYSMDSFSVPSNLYVIGTMNTADRSIALLDTALRRRFDFEELQPDYAVLSGMLVDGIKLGEMLRVMNDRIEYLYDRDHTIGHAYFIDVKDLADLEKIFKRKVIPLLQEYFYEDFAKVCSVLNEDEGFFIKEELSAPKGLDGGDQKFRYTMKKEFLAEAYRKIYE
ncbi:MAG: AAA family ATPase [Gallionella sp.]|nr:AAA family ATPase [Gallionella sp.]